MPRKFITFFLLILISFFSNSIFSVSYSEQYIEEKNEEEPLIKEYSFASYDEIVDLIENIESGELDNDLSPAEVFMINNFLVAYARDGVFSEDSEEYEILEEDIDQLSNGVEEDYILATAVSPYYQMNSFYYNTHSEVILCKSWWKHPIKKTAKFVRHHKKEILIGAAIATGVGIAAVVIISSKSSNPQSPSVPSNVQEEKNEPHETNTSSAENAKENCTKNEGMPSTESSAFQEIVENAKDDIHNNLYATSDNLSYSSSSSWDQTKEVIRDTGAYVAHKTLDEASEIIRIVPELLNETQNICKSITPDGIIDSKDPNVLFPEKTPLDNFESSVSEAHNKIDQIFAVNQADYYTQETKEYRADLQEQYGVKPVIGILPLPFSALGEARLGITQVNSTCGWKVGDKINNLTKTGKTPKWSTVRKRYWKTKANFHPEFFEGPQFNKADKGVNLKRAKKGLPPQQINERTGMLESMELHHNPAQRHGGLFDVEPVWPDAHAQLDKYRKVKK